MGQAKTSEDLMAFIFHTLEKEWHANISSDTYEYERAKTDGRAQMAEKLYNLLEGLIE